MKILNFVTGKTITEIKKILEHPPYNISVKEDEKYYKLNYSQIESDFSQKIVEECRGITFRKSDNKAVCIPFTKFYNFGEARASKIDWSSARVLEKLDGSIISLWYDDGWHVSTNGTIDARNAGLQSPTFAMDHRYNTSQLENYLDLFMFANRYRDLSWIERLDKKYTYIFELVSPYNRIVVPYEDTKIYHIGSRNNLTLMEEDLDIGIEKPKSYGLSSLEECLQATEAMPFSEEGFVVVDVNYNRIKIKSLAYVTAHHLKNNGVVTYSRVLDMIKAGGDDDFVSIYPEYKVLFDVVKEKLNIFIDECLTLFREFQDVGFESRKDFALWATNKKYPSLLFLLVDNKIENTSSAVVNHVLSIDSDKLTKMIGVKE